MNPLAHAVFLEVHAAPSLSHAVERSNHAVYLGKMCFIGTSGTLNENCGGCIEDWKDSGASSLQQSG
jgi:hypothetical protein